ncbi:nitric-oxide synthase [Saccharopolyspora erythraea NRRL 2338]|uniref:Nitric oxide synthase oxygenase n=2 Tax=Saccharopolyspora erythraea TaxID=1836 RepID=A4FQT8_SACEN|nr:nitric oxide synthase oxygenase [Saccharopolyspora erythraea]PFG93015.1 nitric-oxide synthase [Saccharopolyspora erythraea NRRL 2338]QRK89901.1 nitric oxide synthase oxygenase [Saccharopolyspora erythraea]CAM06413.1 nitric oxide synthase oxygenase [Saccharopolyspora erythraea NRRL 2338]
MTAIRGDATPAQQNAPAGPGSAATDVAAAEKFLRAFHDAHPEAGELDPRLAEVRAEIARTGTYRHTPEELAYGARVALRDSGWCTSGVPWRRLLVRDLRGLRNATTVAKECFEHLRLATNAGRIQPLISVFAPDTPHEPGPRIWNEQVVRYAGYAGPGGEVLGDARYVGFTAAAQRLGWRPPKTRGRFDHLPLVVETAHEGPRTFTVPRDLVQEVPLEHPDLPWFYKLGLRWHSVPLVSNMRLLIGGITYPAAPFNTWFVGTEIGTRALADEMAYGFIREVADRIGLDTTSERTLWRDRAIVEINRAVLYSFDSARVTITDHHSETLHRLAWLRTAPEEGTERPAFVAGGEADRRARKGAPACFPLVARTATARATGEPG